MQNFKSSTATVIELRFLMKKMKMKNLTFTCTFYAVTFLHVLYFDVLRRQIEIGTDSKTNIPLCMAIMLDHPSQ